MRRCLIALPLTLGALAAGPSSATADESTPCPADQPRPAIRVTDPAGAGPLYATHELRMSVEAETRSLQAPGFRVFHEDADRLDRATLVSDSPGTFTITATVVIRDTERLPSQDNYSCTTTVSKTVQLIPPTRAKGGKLVRPRLVDRARNLWYRRVFYSFTVKPSGPGADRSPFTVRARVARRAKFPGARARPVSRVYGLREFDYVEQKYRNGCFRALICAPEGPRSFSKGIGVRVEELGSRGLKISVDVPTGYFSRNALNNRIIPTPFGVDVEVLQSGRRVARLRAAGRCDSYGQAANCRFKKASTKP